MTKEINVTDIITSLEPGETPAGYIRGLADQLRGTEGIMMGPVDSDLAALALDRLAASL
jgi:hypothetical protein